MKRLFSLLVALVLLLPAFALAQEPNPTNEASQPYVLNYFEDSPLDTSLYEGKALYLNFFTGWCTYCMQEMPDIKTLYDTYDPDEVAVILVHVWDGEDGSVTDGIRERFGLDDMTILEDEDLTLASIIGLNGYPASIFIDPDGFLYSGFSGMLTLDQMQQQLDDMGISELEAADE